MRMLFIQLGIVSILSIAPATVAADDGPDDMQSLIEEVRSRFDVPGAAGAIMRDGQRVAIGVSGKRHINKPGKVERGDLTLIGSCGKAATRLLIGRLIDQGKLRTDSTLADLFPQMDMRSEYKPVTIAQILGHRGGIPQYTEIGPQRTPILFSLEGSPREQRAAFVKHLLNEAPAAKPDSRFLYSNAGYGLLGHIAETLADMPFEELIRREVFEPLEMSSAVVARPNSGKGRKGLYGHIKGPTGYEPPQGQRDSLPAIAPAGGMSCSIEDFAKLAAMLARCEAGKPGEFLKPETALQLRELRPGSHTSEGEIFFGGDGWYTAAFALWPSKQVAIVVGSNGGEGDEFCTAVVNAIRKKYAPDLSATNRPPGRIQIKR